eukprot:13875963-Heterocapsa_arctica.AAC.1
MPRRLGTAENVTREKSSRTGGRTAPTPRLGCTRWFAGLPLREPLPRSDSWPSQGLPVPPRAGAPSASPA